MQESHAKLVWFLHVHVFFDLCNMQKSVTQIIYLWPLPNSASELMAIHEKIIDDFCLSWAKSLTLSSEYVQRIPIIP